MLAIDGPRAGGLGETGNGETRGSGHARRGDSGHVSVCKVPNNLTAAQSDVRHGLMASIRNRYSLLVAESSDSRGILTITKKLLRVG